MKGPEGQNYYYYLLKAYSPVNRTGLPQDFSQVQNVAQVQYNTKTCTLHKRTTHKHNPKGSPFGIALVKNGK